MANRAVLISAYTTQGEDMTTKSERLTVLS
jgi:hypothetical protein